MRPPTNLKQFHIELERLSWRDKLVLNAHGALAILLIIVIVLGSLELINLVKNLIKFLCTI